MGESSMHDERAGSTGARGRRPRVVGGFPFQRRVALTERDGALLIELGARENLSVGAYLAQLIERHLAGSHNPLPTSARDLVGAVNTVSGDLRAVLRQARAEGGLLNQIARHLNTHNLTGTGIPDAMVGPLGRALSRYVATTTAIDEMLRRTDQLLTSAAAVLGVRERRAPQRGWSPG